MVLHLYFPKYPRIDSLLVKIKHEYIHLVNSDCVTLDLAQMYRQSKMKAIPARR
jgi:hypothetical protein